MTNRLGLWLTEMLALLLSSCYSGPTPERLATERAWWQAVKTTTADGTIDEAEAPLLAQLLADWDVLLTKDEGGTGAKDPKAMLTELLRVYGVATVQVILGPELMARAPTVFKLLDANQNGILEEQEIMGLDPADPVTAVVVVQTIYQLMHKPK